MTETRAVSPRPWITVSPRAFTLIANVRCEHDDDVALMLTDGCCDGTAPMLVRTSLVSSINDEWIGEVAGVPVYASEWSAPRYSDCWLEIGTQNGIGSGLLSLEASHRMRLTLAVSRIDTTRRPAQPYRLTPLNKTV